MSYKTRLKIGEFSQMMQVTVKTLRHYEQKGLLLPDEVDEWTGYRYYSIDQMQKLSAIRELQQLGFSLDEIKDLFDDDSHSPSNKQLSRKIDETEQQLRKLVARRDQLLCWLNSRKKIKTMERISIQKLPAIIVASYRTIINKPSDLGELCVNVIGPEMARLGCKCPPPGYCFSVVHDDEYKPTDIDIEYCEQVEEMGTDSDIIKFKKLDEVPFAICMKCYGPYEKMPQNYIDMYAYLEMEGYKIVGAFRANYVDGIWNQEDPEKWLTIIQVPVEKA